MASGFAEEHQAAFTGIPVDAQLGVGRSAVITAKLKLGPGSRVVIPAAMREQLGINEGDSMMATLENGELKLVSMMESVRRAQAMVRAHVPAGVSLVDQLLEDRREEVMRDRKRG